MGVTFKWNKPIAQIAKDATGGDATLKFMASEARRLMNPYVPFAPVDGGSLAGVVDVGTEGGKGMVHYKVPYAHRQYNGEGFNFSKEPHEKATAHWDEAMMKERKQDLVRAVQAFIKRGSK